MLGHLCPNTYLNPMAEVTATYPVTRARRPLKHDAHLAF
jgi:hypothetical protein